MVHLVSGTGEIERICKKFPETVGRTVSLSEFCVMVVDSNVLM